MLVGGNAHCHHVGMCVNDCWTEYYECRTVRPSQVEQCRLHAEACQDACCDDCGVSPNPHPNCGPRLANQNLYLRRRRN
jgi:hypothetical protein